MRALILGGAALCYGAALAIAWAGIRLPVPKPPAETSASAQEILVPASPAPAPVVSVDTPPAPTIPTPSFSETHLLTAVEDLAREQAASRELVSELRSTVARLQEELSRQSSGLTAEKPQGRTLAVLGGDLLPAGRETLDPAAGDVVRSLIADIQADPRLIVSVEGHTDSRPVRSPFAKPFKDNASLSLLRAHAVADLLATQGVPKARIRVKGWGDVRPLASNDTAEGRDRNRRVEIRLLSVPAAP